MKTMAMLMAALAATTAFSFEDVQVTYRGRVRENGAAPAAQTVPMTFRLYAKKSDSAPSWTTDIPAVRIDTNGLFQVALRGEGLAEAIDADRVNWIGVSIGGGREQYPRQAERRLLSVGFRRLPEHFRLGRIGIFVYFCAQISKNQ